MAPRAGGLPPHLAARGAEPGPGGQREVPAGTGGGRSRQAPRPGGAGRERRMRAEGGWCGRHEGREGLEFCGDSLFPSACGTGGINEGYQLRVEHGG